MVSLSSSVARAERLIFERFLLSDAAFSSRVTSGHLLPLYGLTTAGQFTTTVIGDGAAPRSGTLTRKRLPSFATEY